MNQYERLRALGSSLTPRSDGSLRILDVGAGHGAVTYSPHFAELASHYVGVDPDEDILENPWLDEIHHRPVEEYANAHAERIAAGDDEPFDAGTAIYVWEHLPDPEGFLRSVRAVLRPGATFLCITPNGLHPFGILSKVTAKLGVTDQVLRKLRPEEIDDYHFPVVATRNTIWGVRSAAEAAGFSKAEVLLHDEPGVFAHYLPGQLKRLPFAYSKVISVANLDVLSGTLLIRLTA